MFKYKYLTLTQLGTLFGVSSHKVGQWLVEIGLRTDKKRPSKAAFDGGYCDTGPTRGEGYHWVWHAEKTVKALEQAGYERVVNPNSDLVETPRLNGPFRSRPSNTNGFEIINGDGTVAICVVGKENARLVARLLNLAHERGVIERTFADKTFT